jgi:hypothetical protein
MVGEMIPVGPHRAIRGGGFVFCLCMTAAGLAAQRTGGLRLHRWEGELRLEARYRDETRSSQFNEIAETEQAFRETLKLVALGSYYHPRFLEFSLMTEAGFEQLETDQVGAVRPISVDSLNLGYELRTRFLKEHPYSFDLYTLRAERQTKQNFFATTEAVIDETGLSALAKDWWIPSSLELKRYRYNGRGADTNEEVRDSAVLQGVRYDKNSRNEYSISYENLDLMSQNTQIEDFDYLLSTSQHFGSANEHNYALSTRYREQRGTIDTDITTLSGTTFFKLSEDLESNTRVDWEDQGTGGPNRTQTTTLYGESVLRHRLYDSMNNDLRLEWRDSRFQEGKQLRYGVSARFEYRKEIPIGRLVAHYAPDVTTQENESSTGDIQVLDEAHTYNPGTSIVLDNIGVRLATIIVTNQPPAPITIYTTPADYIVSTLVGRARLDIPIGSRILANQTILVDYSYAPQPDVRFRTVGQSVGLGIRFLDFASLEAFYADSQDRLLSGVDAGTLNDQRIRRVRGDIYYAKASIAAEYERQDSSLLPFERLEYTASTELPFAKDVQCYASGSHYQTRFLGESSRENGTNGSINLTWNISTSTFLRMRGEYRKVDLRTDVGEGYLFESDLGYRIRKTQIDLRLLFADENFEIATDQRRYEAKLTFSRRF